MLGCVGRGGSGGDGQAIRDEILHIMHRHHLPECKDTHTHTHTRVCVCVCVFVCVCVCYADVCWHMLMYADVCWYHSIHLAYMSSGKGTFIQELHQKLHNNSTPDGIIC